MMSVCASGDLSGPGLAGLRPWLRLVEAGQVALLPVQVARRVLPDREIPVYLAAGAPAEAGAVEWPVAVGAGLAYAAIKRWSRSATMAG